MNGAAKHPWRRRLVALFVLALVTLVVVRSLSRFLLFPGCTQELPPPGAPIFSGATAVDYVTKDGVALRGAWVRTGRPGALTAIYFHGNAEAAASGLPLGAELMRSGVDVFLAEYRGYGGRPGSPSEAGLFLDGEAALDLVLATGVTNERLVLVGRSLGTGVAVELAQRGHGCALVLVSPYTSIVDLGRKMVGPLAPLLVADPFDSLSRIGRVKVPVVAIHGTADTLIPFEHGKRIIAAAPRGKLVPVEGRGHNDLDEGALLARELVPMLEAARAAR